MSLSRYRAERRRNNNFVQLITMQNQQQQLNNNNNPIQNPRDIQWNTMYEILYRYYKRHGNVNVSYSAKNPELRKLAKWIACQRQRYIKNTLPDREYDLLNKINFRWTTKNNLYDNKWIEQYDKLKVYAQRNNGSTRITASDNPDLALWVSNQRKLYVAKKLKQDRIDLLNKIHFQWVVQTKAENQKPVVPTEFDKNWYAMYEQLKDYRTKYGNCNVPFDYKTNPTLASWVANQRRIYHQKCWNDQLPMPPVRKELLNEINFQWTINWHDSHNNINNHYPKSSCTTTATKNKQQQTIQIEEEEEQQQQLGEDEDNDDNNEDNEVNATIVKKEYKRKYKNEEDTEEVDDNDSIAATKEEIRIPKKTCIVTNTATVTMDDVNHNNYKIEKSEVDDTTISKKVEENHEETKTKILPNITVRRKQQQLNTYNNDDDSISSTKSTTTIPAVYPV